MAVISVGMQPLSPTILLLPCPFCTPRAFRRGALPRWRTVSATWRARTTANAAPPAGCLPLRAPALRRTTVFYLRHAARHLSRLTPARTSPRRAARTFALYALVGAALPAGTSHLTLLSSSLPLGLHLTSPYHLSHYLAYIPTMSISIINIIISILSYISCYLIKMDRQTWR